MPSFVGNEPVPVVGLSPYDAPTNGHRFNVAWSEILVGLLEFALWPDFWSGSPTEIDIAITHVQELMGILSGQSMRNMMIARHKENTGVHAGGNAADTWQKRKLSSYGGFGDFWGFDDDVFSLDPGDYYVQAYAVAFMVRKHSLRLTCSVSQNTQVGLACYAPIASSNSHSTVSFVEQVFTLAAPATLQLDHYTELEKTVNGLGVASSSGEDEIYATLRIVKLR